MAFCFPLPFDWHRHPKLLSFFKPCSPAKKCHLSDDDDDGHADDDDFDLDRKHVIISEIHRRAVIKKRSRPQSSSELGRVCPRLLLVPPLPQANKAGDEEERVNTEEDCKAREESEDEYYSVRSCFSRCSAVGEEIWWEEKGTSWERTAAGLTDELFRECDGWPFGLWRRRKVAILPPLPKSPSDSWAWYKRNRSNGKVWPAAQGCDSTDAAVS